MQDTYTILNGDLTFIHQEGTPKPTEDPIWLTDHLPKFKEGASICDVGSGIGTISLILLLKNKKNHIIGYEIDESLVKASKKNAKLNQFKNCFFESRDILKNPPNKKFDHVVSNPPYHSTNRGFESKNKQQAHGMSMEDMRTWVKMCLNITKKGGTCTFIHHTQNIEDLSPLWENYNVTLTSIQTSPKRPAKRVVVHIQI